MSMVNQVKLIGHIGKVNVDGENVYISFATNDFGGKDEATGERKEYTEWHSLAFFGTIGKSVARWAWKGRFMYIEGRLQTRKKPQGKFTNIVVEAYKFLDKYTAPEGEAPTPEA